MNNGAIQIIIQIAIVGVGIVIQLWIINRSLEKIIKLLEKKV